MNIQVVTEIDTVVLKVNGKFDFSCLVEFNLVTEPFLRQKSAKHLCLDFSDVDVIDSTGLSMLLMCREKAEEVEVKMKLRHVNADIRSILETAAMAQCIEVGLVGESVK